ncbi:MAG: hypothetical protein AABX39_05250, partial [Nanoarchaeota archaeon]
MILRGNVLIIALLMSIILVSGCVTQQDPVKRVCSRLDFRGSLSVQECSKELYNVYNAIENNDARNCDLVLSEALKLSCQQSVSKINFDEFVKKYFGTDT